MKVIREVIKVTENIIQINFELPEGHTAEELTKITILEIEELIKSGQLFGNIVRLYGRMTIGMACALGHKLSHVCKKIEVFDPKEKVFFVVVKH